MRARTKRNRKEVPVNLEMQILKKRKADETVKGVYIIPYHMLHYVILFVVRYIWIPFTA